MIKIRINVDGGDSDTESLRDWLSREDDLRGTVGYEHLPQPSGTMGALTEIVVAAGSSSVLVAIAEAVHVWLVQRRSDLKVTVKGPHSRSVTVEVSRARDAEQLLRQILDWSDGTAESTRPS